MWLLNVTDRIKKNKLLMYIFCDISDLNVSVDKIKMNQQKMNLSQATTFILDNNCHIALSSMNELFKILWIIPVNSCERSFTSLRRLKNYLRNSMGSRKIVRPWSSEYRKRFPN